MKKSVQNTKSTAVLHNGNYLCENVFFHKRVLKCLKLEIISLFQLFPPPFNGSNSWVFPGQARIDEFQKCLWLCWQPSAPLRAEGDEQAVRTDSPSPMTSSFPDSQNTSQSCKMKVWDDFRGHKDSESHFYILYNGIKKGQ